MSRTRAQTRTKVYEVHDGKFLCTDFIYHFQAFASSKISLLQSRLRQIGIGRLKLRIHPAKPYGKELDGTRFGFDCLACATRDGTPPHKPSYGWTARQPRRFNSCIR